MSKAKAASKAETPKQVQAIYYRVERVSTYAWQPYRLTIFADGSMIEEFSSKEDVFHFTAQRISEQMKAEGQSHFELMKAQAHAAEMAAIEKGKEKIRAEQRAAK